MHFGVCGIQIQLQKGVFPEYGSPDMYRQYSEACKKFGHPWLKFLLLWIIKLVEDELISERRKGKDETLFSMF